MYQRLVAASPTVATSSQANAASSRELSAGTPPWRLESPDPERLTQLALKSGDLISDSVSRKALSSSEDTPKIFAAYEALTTLRALANGVAEGDLNDAYLSRAETRINEGLTSISAFLESADLQKVTLLQGDKLSRAESDVAITRASYDYTTKPVYTGDSTLAVDAWAGVSGFDITISGTNSSQTITVDLSGLADADRTLENVADLINTELETAGAVTRFAHTKIGPLDDNGIPQGDDWGFKITGSQSEKISFSTSTAKPAIYMLGESGGTDAKSAQLSKWTNIESAAPTRAMTDLFLATETTNASGDVEHNDTRFIATATGPDGALYALGNTKGEIDGQALRADNDLVLIKYDSTGKQAWSRMIGATQDTKGAALAVSADGRIAIGGSTEGELATDATGGGVDGFVLMYDSDGLEIMARQEGSTFDDEVTALAFDSSGALFVGGKTKGGMGDAAHNGGLDAFVEKLDSSGERLWINQWGAAGDEVVTAIAVDDTDAAIVATRVDGDAVIQRVSDATSSAADWSHSIGNGAVTSLAWDAGALYAAGETRLDGRSAGAFSGSTLPDPDAFAMRMDVSGVTVTESWFSRFGGDGEQTAATIISDGGQVYLAGSGATGFGSAVADGDSNAYLTSLNADTGAENWATNLQGRGGISTAAGIALSQTGDSALNLFGLPEGELMTGDTSHVSDRTSARPGDHFYLSVEGGRKKKITLETGDTYRSLSFRINAAMVLDGKADVKRGTDGQALRIVPNENTRIELISGSADQDLLSALGMPSGVIFNASTDSNGDTESDAPPIVAMGLRDGVSMTSTEEAESVVAMLDSALLALRKAYRYAIDDPTLTQITSGSTSQNSTGPSAYQQTQLANLQAGLARLQAGSSTSNLFA